jgi:hypothetical protein
MRECAVPWTAARTRYVRMYCALRHTARAEHRSNLAFVYGGRKAASRTFKPEGGPDDRKDMSMAKLLANRSQRKVEFNRVPPHFSPEFISTIPFDKIVPNYCHLPANIVKMLPFL